MGDTTAVVPRCARPLSWRTYLFRVALFGLIYWFVAITGADFGRTPEGIWLIWPSAGVAIAGLLVYGVRLWPGIALGVVLNALYTGNFPWITIACSSVGSTLAAVIPALMLNRFSQGVPAMNRVRDVLAFFYIAGLFGPIISATFGVLGFYLGGLFTTAELFQGGLTWWMADGLGVILPGSLLLTWFHGWPKRPRRRDRIVELCAVTVTTLCFGAILNWPNISTLYAEPLVFVGYPIVLWAGLQFGQHGATLVSLTISLFAFRGLLVSAGPFAMHPDGNAHALIALYLISLNLTSMVLAAASRERRVALVGQSESEIRYRDLANATFVGLMVHNGTEVLEVNRAFSEMLGYEPNAIIGRTPFDFFATRSESALAAIGENSETLPHETFANRSDGTLLNVEIIGKTTRFRGADARVILVRDLSERTEAEREIARLGTFYAQVLHEMPAEMAVWDTEHRYMFVNAAAVRDPELREWLIGKTNFEYCALRGVDTSMAERRHEAFMRALNTRENVRYEEMLTAARGQKKHFVRYLSPVLNARGEVTHVLGYGMDITELKRMQSDLDRIHQSLRCLVWHGPVLIDGDYYFWDMTLTDEVAAQKFLPLELKENENYLAALKRIRLAFEGDNWITHARFTGALARGETYYQGEYRVRLANGSVRWLCEDVYIERVRADRLQLFGVTTDVTQLKQSEEALRMTVELYRNVVETSHDVVWSIDREGSLTFLNRAARGTFGLDTDRLLGVRFLCFLNRSQRVEAHLILDRLWAGEAVRFMTLHYTRQDGSAAVLSVNAVPLKDANGTIVGAAGTCADITDMQMAEQERERLESQMRHAQKLESLGVLAGGIAHDFNNLLVGILGHAGLALMELPQRSPVRDNVKHIETAALRAAELTNQMLAYAGKGKFVITSLNLTKIVSGMAHLLEVSISKKAILKYEFDEQIPSVEGDATQISQVIMNLITNASDALDDNPGVISVRTGVMHADAELLGKAYMRDGIAEGEYAFLEVSDTGVGMSEETVSRIFEPFFTTKFTGRGLGLAAVLGIVRAHRGTLLIESAPGAGSTFCVLLPACGATVLTPPEPNTFDHGVHDAPVKILVVDDEEFVRNVVQEILEHYGYVVLTAKDGYEAIELFRKEADDIVVIVLDMLMPIMDGGETLSQLRAIRHDVPVVLTSGYSEQEATRHMAIDAQSAFIQKPYPPAALIEKIQALIHASAHD